MQILKEGVYPFQLKAWEGVYDIDTIADGGNKYEQSLTGGYGDVSHTSHRLERVLDLEETVDCKTECGPRSCRLWPAAEGKDKGGDSWKRCASRAEQACARRGLAAFLPRDSGARLPGPSGNWLPAAYLHLSAASGTPTHFPPSPERVRVSPLMLERHSARPLQTGRPLGAPEHRPHPAVARPARLDSADPFCSSVGKNKI